MAERVHILLDRGEKEQFRRLAAREGKSLSEWLRGAARDRLADADAAPNLGTPEALREFFEQCDRREQGREPDWEEHRGVIERSIGAGTSQT
jgi:hypothetical protein